MPRSNLKTRHCKRSAAISLLLSCVFLAACSPLSIFSYAISAGVAIQADQDQRDYEKRKRYTDKCLPIDEKKDAYREALQAEGEGKFVSAYEYYNIAHLMGDGRADKAISTLKPRMKPEDLKQAEHNLQLYTEENVKSCYLFPGQTGRS